MQAPVNEDTLCIYNISATSREFVWKNTDIYGNNNDQAVILEDEIIYNNGAKVWRITKENAKWQAEELPDMQFSVLAPAMDEYLLRQDDGVVINDFNDETWAKANIGYVTIAKWRAGGDEIAMITDDGSAVSLWDPATDSVKKLAVGRELPAVRDWVEINGLNYSADGKYLLISFLCESGNCLVLWDTKADEAVDEKYFTAELTILDVSYDQALYTIDAGMDAHVLGIYDFQTQKLTSIEQGGMVYTAACRLSEEQALISKFSLENEENTLSVLNLSEYLAR